MATILLVEDDTSMRLLTTAKLKHRYAIISVQDGVEPWTCWNGSQWT